MISGSERLPSGAPHSHCRSTKVNRLASRTLPFVIFLWDLITGLRSLASTTSHQTIEGAKISASSTLRKIIRRFERRECTIFASDLLDRSFERSRQAEGIITAGSHFTISSGFSSILFCFCAARSWNYER
jgi:hypothetical protein